MSLRLEKKHIIILFIAALLAVLLYFGAYFLYLNPLKVSLSLKESHLKSEQQLGLTLETRLASVNGSDFSSTAEMQKLLPVDPMIEQFVLDLEKAEVVSNSYITSIEFTDGKQGNINVESESNQEEGSIEAVQSEDIKEQGDSAVEEQKVAMRMPEGLAKTSATIVVEAANYFELEKFIETLEQLQRIVMVESIAFSGPEEMVSLLVEEEPIEMTLTVNTFYLPGLEDLKEYNPKVETPEPANKRNPFPTFGGFSEESLTEYDQIEESNADNDQQ
jgi:type IV pilus assembly protein PilO